MKNNISIKLKAIFLLIVFALNTVVGFACAMGHLVTVTHSHGNDALPHQHGSDASHHHGSGHHHHGTEALTHTGPAEKEKGGCCSDEVVKFQHIEKNLTQNVKVGYDAPVFFLIKNSFFNTCIFKAYQPAPQKSIASFFHPPPPDILIAIQRFQI